MSKPVHKREFTLKGSDGRDHNRVISSNDDILELQSVLVNVDLDGELKSELVTNKEHSQYRPHIEEALCSLFRGNFEGSPFESFPYEPVAIKLIVEKFKVILSRPRRTDGRSLAFEVLNLWERASVDVQKIHTDYGIFRVQILPYFGKPNTSETRPWHPSDHDYATPIYLAQVVQMKKILGNNRYYMNIVHELETVRLPDYDTRKIFLRGEKNALETPIRNKAAETFKELYTCPWDRKAKHCIGYQTGSCLCTDRPNCPVHKKRAVSTEISGAGPSARNGVSAWGVCVPVQADGFEGSQSSGGSPYSSPRQFPSVPEYQQQSPYSSPKKFPSIPDVVPVQNPNPSQVQRSNSPTPSSSTWASESCQLTPPTKSGRHDSNEGQDWQTGVPAEMFKGPREWDNSSSSAVDRMEEEVESNQPGVPEPGAQNEAPQASFQEYVLTTVLSGHYAQYREAFELYEYTDLESMQELDDEDLIDLGVTRRLERRKILQKIEKLARRMSISSASTSV